MGFQEWKKEELQNITEELKKIPSDRRQVVRDQIKGLSAGEALAAVLAVLAVLESPGNDSKPFQGDNMPITEENRLETSVNTLERVTGEIDTEDIDTDGLKLQIDNYIETFCTKHAIDDMRKAEQTVFQALCMDIGKDIFRKNKVVRDNHLYDNGSATRTNNNKVSIPKLIQAIDIYDYYVSLYGKVFTLWGCAAFVGVSREFIYENAEKLTLSGVDMKQKAEFSLNDAIVSGKRNPTGAICILNAKHNYATAGQTGQTVIKEKTIVYPALISNGQLKIGVAGGEK